MSSYAVNEVLNAISEAQSAYAKVPELERTINDLTAEVSVKDSSLSTANDRIAELEKALADTKSTLASKEAELDEATFRELLAQEKLGKVREMFALVGDITNKGLTEVTPEPEPQSQPSPEPASVPTASNPSQTEPTQSGEGSSTAEILTYTPPTSVEPIPMNEKPDDYFAENHFSGWAWYLKPGNVSWERFVALGGEAEPNRYGTNF